jgi:uncharacterized protein
MNRWWPRVLIIGLSAFVFSCAGRVGPAPRVGQSSDPRPAPAAAPPSAPPASVSWVRSNYEKREAMIPVRDGAKLFTAIYSPRDKSKTYPILMRRTPYSSGPYGADEFPDKLGTCTDYDRDGYIFVFQDVRGRYLSEGTFENMRPHVAGKSGRTIDESSDTYDSIDWLVKNVPNNNGRVGLLGISYPGFYASAGMIDHHPALVAVSPQASIADWYFDDFFHHGAFFLPHAFNFFRSFGKPRPVPTTQSAQGFEHGTNDGYKFFLALGALSNVNPRWYHNEIAFWNAIAAHPNRDSFWQARNILPHLKNVAPNVLVVGGWFDAENLYGALNTYQAVERQNPTVSNSIVMGPWAHGGWSRGDGDRLGNIAFGERTSRQFQLEMEFAFFRRHLKALGDPGLPEAYMFETGVNRWRRFTRWPPATTKQWIYLREDWGLSGQPPTDANGYDEFLSDPANPVPFTEEITIGMPREYMTEDQRFARKRPDVLTYRSAPLTSDVTLAGPLVAELHVSTTQEDADWIVKLIDEFPPDAADPADFKPTRPHAGYMMMVRSEVIRGRFREGYDQPRPFTPDQPTRVRLPLQDVLHTFKRGHRMVIQVQSTWFPLVDRNPQNWVPNIFEARDSDFTAATHRVYRSPARPSHIEIGVLETR